MLVTQPRHMYKRNSYELAESWSRVAEQSWWYLWFTNAKLLHTDIVYYTVTSCQDWTIDWTHIQNLYICLIMVKHTSSVSFFELVHVELPSGAQHTYVGIRLVNIRSSEFMIYLIKYICRPYCHDAGLLLVQSGNTSPEVGCPTQHILCNNTY